MAKVILPLICLILSATDATEEAATPIAVLKAHDAEIEKLLHEAGDSLAAETRDKIKHHINATFDLAELARLSLGTHWDERSAAERQHFTEVFGAIVQERNLDTFLRYYREGEIIYREELIEADKATVKAVAPLKRGEEIEILYHLHRLKAQWRVYDLTIDGASTAEGNRRQYVRRIEKKSYDSLIQSLEKQLARLQKKKS